MESRVNALEECFKEAEKRLDEVDKKVDAVFQEAEDVKNGGKGGAYAMHIHSIFPIRLCRLNRFDHHLQNHRRRHTNPS